MFTKNKNTGRIILMGAGAFARETYWAISENKEEFGKYSVVGFLDDDINKIGTPVLPENNGKITSGFKILGSLDHILNLKNIEFDYILPAIGSTESKKKFTERLLASKCKLPGPVIHRSAETGFDNTFGDGTIIFSLSTITVNCVIGRQVNIYHHCSIAHDVIIEDFCNLSPGVHITGGAHLEEGVNIGTGAIVLPRIHIGKWSVIGAGAVVTNDIPPYSVAVGMPAKVIETKKNN